MGHSQASEIFTAKHCYFNGDSTPKAVVSFFDKTIEGFGEIFRLKSLDDIGMYTIHSRAVAGLANKPLQFCPVFSPYG